jgi:hypothetical protein
MEKTSLKPDNRPIVVFSQVLIAEIKKIQHAYNPSMGRQCEKRVSVFMNCIQKIVEFVTN